MYSIFLLIAVLLPAFLGNLKSMGYVLSTTEFSKLYLHFDRLCGLVVRVSGYRYRGPGFDPRRYQIF